MEKEWRKRKDDKRRSSIVDLFSSNSPKFKHSIHEGLKRWMDELITGLFD